jgi:hypothetical protein
MMGSRQIEQGVLFYNFSLDAHVPADHLLRSIDRFVELSELRRELARVKRSRREASQPSHQFETMA